MGKLKGDKDPRVRDIARSKSPEAEELVDVESLEASDPEEGRKPRLKAV